MLMVYGVWCAVVQGGKGKGKGVGTGGGAGAVQVLWSHSRAAPPDSTRPLVLLHASCVHGNRQHVRSLQPLGQFSTVLCCPCTKLCCVGALSRRHQQRAAIGQPGGPSRTSPNKHQPQAHHLLTPHRCCSTRPTATPATLPAGCPCKTSTPARPSTAARRVAVQQG